MSSTSTLSWKSIVGYGLGDMANNLAFAMGALFLLNYYTDVVGISAAAAGTMLASIRIYDSVMDILAGRLIDKTTTRWGKFRPFILFGSVPLMLLSVAVFSVPASWAHADKLLYAYITYALFGTAYSFVNISYGSMATVMSQVPAERAKLSASRGLLATMTFAFLAMLIGPLLKGHAGSQEIFTRCTLILGAIAVVLYFLCFKSAREIVSRPAEKPLLGESLRTIACNKPLLILCTASVFVLIGYFSMTATTMFYAKYVLRNPASFGLIIAIMTLGGSIITSPLVPLLVRRFGKKHTFCASMFVAAIGFLLVFLAGRESLTAVFAAFLVASLGSNSAMTVIWALEADTIEYGEWKTGVRIEGLTYSFFSFTRKCGQAFGGSIPAFILAGANYIPNAISQTESATIAIRQGVALVPAIAFACACLLMMFYPLTDAVFGKIVEEIKTRKNQKIRASDASHNTTSAPDFA